MYYIDTIQVIIKSIQTLLPTSCVTCTTMPNLLQTSLALHTIRLAYRELGSQVNRAIHTQVGDEARLNEQVLDAHRLMTSLKLVHWHFKHH